MKKYFTKKMVSGLVIGCFSLSFGTIALAHDVQNDPLLRPGMHDAKFPNPENREKHINDILDNLVEEGTITQDQATKLLNFFKEKDSQRKSEMEKMKTMSPEERETYHQQMFNKRPDILQELKDIADLSDEQAKTVSDLVRPPHRPGPEGMPNPDNWEHYINTSIDKLIKEGTITQDQATKLLNFFKEKDSQRKSEMEKMNAMSPEERDAYHQQMFNKRPDILQELKDVADLSDEQAKTVADMVRPPHRPGPEDGPCCPMMPNP
jgi:polyhydroxyalkanoate synthesis regulator phasin